MTKLYFDLNDDFEAIIKARLRNVIDVSKIPTGWTNYVYKATTQNGASYIFRFPRHDFWIDSLKKEVWFNRFIKDKTGFKTVNIKYKKLGKRGYGMHRYINGMSLTEAFPLMNEHQKRRLAADISAYIIKLRDVNVSELKLPTFSEFLAGLAQVNGDKDYNYMEVFKPLMKKEKNTSYLVHGDFNPGNILVNKKFKMIAVLDYAFASLSDGPADLSVLLARTPKDFRDLMISEYEKVSNQEVDRRVLDDYIQVRLDVEKDYINYMARCHKDVVLPTL